MDSISVEDVKKLSVNDLKDKLFESYQTNFRTEPDEKIFKSQKKVGWFVSILFTILFFWKTALVFLLLGGMLTTGSMILNKAKKSKKPRTKAE